MTTAHLPVKSKLLLINQKLPAHRNTPECKLNRVEREKFWHVEPLRVSVVRSIKLSAYGRLRWPTWIRCSKSLVAN